MPEEGKLFSREGLGNLYDVLVILVVVHALALLYWLIRVAMDREPSLRDRVKDIKES